MFKGIKIVFIFLFLLTLSACAEDTKVSEDNWQNEVIFATECGHDGQQCCIDEDSPCLYEQECCVDPNDPKATYCAESCSFGEPNTFCRDTEPKCNETSVCYDGYCQIAGGNNQPCFLDGKCKNGAVCFDGLCVQCGLPGNPCCDDGEYKCKNEKVFDKTRTDCIEGVCVECGYATKKTCLSEPSCNPNHLENNNFCLMCGEENKPCCRDDNQVFCKEGFECMSGFCIKNKK